MKKKLTEILSTRTGYNWQYCSLGGVTRVKITSGADIAHLDELDRKLWSVLSCPTTGLEFDAQTLQYLDTDHDGKIRVDEVIGASQWLKATLKNLEILTEGNAAVSFDNLRTDTDEGSKMLAACQCILNAMDRSSQQICIQDITHFKKILAEQADDAKGEAVEPPYADIDKLTAAADSAMREKVSDFYLRCRFMRFDDECTAALDVNKERVATVAAGNLATAEADIAAFPIARPNSDAVLPIEALNPVWEKKFEPLKAALEQEYPGSTQIAESEWNNVIAKIDAYAAAVKDSTAKAKEKIDTQHAEVNAAIAEAEHLLLLVKNFYTFIKNYIFFKDFYTTGANAPKAIFQAGRLFIDQRCCELCLKIDNIDTHFASASLSGMYLIYCTCTAKKGGAKMNIVAVLTDGDIDNLRVGKNAIFYDRDGNDWDAVVVKLVDNPISIRQAFWSPYRKFWNWCTEKLNKSAAEKENKAFEDMTVKADSATTNLATKVKSGESADKAGDKDKKTPFDIAKFAGIFAAIGMAVGYISSAAVGLTKSIGDNPLHLLILVLGIILVVSGPSMFIAWSKLRKRNLGPLLNASGWAINAVILVNVRFGATLTSIATYPKLVFDDPFAEKKMPKWKKWLLWIGILLIVAAGVVGIFVLLPHIGDILPTAPVDSIPVDAAAAPAPAE